MIIEQHHAVSLEHIVRSVMNCDRGGLAGLVSSDTYRTHPLEAAIICTAHLYNKNYNDEIDDFFVRWRAAFNDPEENQDAKIEDYISELRDLVQLLKS